MIMIPPVHFGKYLLIEKIGTGGMAELFMAKQTGLKGFEKVLAIKRILPHLTEDSEFISMFINEAKLAALLSHENIVQIFDLGHVENAYFIAMEYVMGKDLRTILQRARALDLSLSIDHVLLIVSKICNGLDYAHRKKDLSGRDLNIVHRDISPQNILVSYEGEVKIVDFGIAKAASQSSETRTGMLKGKLSYMAPEQAWGKPIDRRADIFSIGIVLYEALTGHKLFKGDNDLNTLERVRAAKVEPPPTSLNKAVTPELEAIILKALAKEPVHRFQSASEFQTALEDHMSEKGYNFSTGRLSRFLRNLFQGDIERDSSRFKAALSEILPQGSEVSSTLIRLPRSRVDSSPSRSIGRTASGLPRKSGWHAARVAVLTGILILGSAVLISMLKPLFIKNLSSFYLEVHIAVDRLSQWPNQVSGWIHAIRVSLTIPSVPALEDFPVPSREANDPDSPSLSGPLPALEWSGEEEPVSPAEIRSRQTALIKPGVGTLDKPQPLLTEQEKAEARRHLEMAKAAYGEGRWMDVETSLRRSIEINPDIPMTYHLLGMLRLERNNPDDALRLFEQASRKFPDNSLLHYDLGFLYFKRGVSSLAGQELKKAVNQNPSDPRADRARLILRQLAGSAGGASAIQSRTIETEP